MSAEWKSIAQLIEPIFCVFLGGILSRFFEKKSKLVAYYGHIASFSTPRDNDTPLQVYTHSIVLLNSGKIAANNVRIKHRNLPGFEIHPSIQHKIEQLSGAEKEIIISKLIPGEQLTISYLYFPPLTYENVTTEIKSDEGFAKILKVIPTPQLPKWQANFIKIIFLLGIVAILYIVLPIIKHCWMLIETSPAN